MTFAAVSSCSELVSAVDAIVTYTRGLAKNGKVCSPRGAAGKAYTIVLSCAGSYDDCPDPVANTPMIKLNAEVSLTVVADRQCKTGDARPVLSSGDYDTSNGIVADSPMFAAGRALIEGGGADNDCTPFDANANPIYGGALTLDSIVLDGRGVRTGILASFATKVRRRALCARARARLKVWAPQKKGAWAVLFAAGCSLWPALRVRVCWLPSLPPLQQLASC